jgi:1-aminocyclopropane-1-carboxylate deaminase
VGSRSAATRTRKLEYLAADALAEGCDALVSIGGVQSNHTRQVAAVAAQLGLRCVLVQESWVDWPDAVYDRVGNIQLSRILGAEVRLVEAGFGIGFKESWESALADVTARGGKPYAIPAGASDHPLGGLGYARWAGEVADQERRLGVFFDTVVVCSVTGSTQAGMIAGFAAQERERRVLGIDGSAKPAETLGQVARIARATAELIDVGRDLRDDEIVLDDRWHAGAYGIPDAKTLAAIRLRGAARGSDHRPCVRGQVDGRADRPRPQGRDRPRLERAIRPPGRPARAQRVLGAVPMSSLDSQISESPKQAAAPAGRRGTRPRRRGSARPRRGPRAAP